MKNMTAYVQAFGRELRRTLGSGEIHRSTVCHRNMSAETKEQQLKPVETSIVNKLEERFKPKHLSVINESYMHNVPKGSETHFKVLIVSDDFEAQPLIKRHRMVNEILNYELQNGVHALSIIAKTPQQWEETCKEVEPSPACRGGFGK